MQPRLRLPGLLPKGVEAVGGCRCGVVTTPSLLGLLVEDEPVLAGHPQAIVFARVADDEFFAAFQERPAVDGGNPSFHRFSPCVFWVVPECPVFRHISPINRSTVNANDSHYQNERN